MKTLEAHKDSHKEVGEFSLLKVVPAGSPAGLCSQVVRAAEEAASTLAGSIHSEQCIKVLCPIVQTADYPINLAAIKMQTKVIERIPKEALVQLLPDIIPGLLQVSGWRRSPQTFWVEAQRLRARRSSPPENAGVVSVNISIGLDMFARTLPPWRLLPRTRRPLVCVCARARARAHGA